MWNNPNKMLLATNVLSSAATLIPNPIAPRRHRQLHANAHDGPRVARVKHHQKQHAPYQRPSRLRGHPDDDDMTFVSSQGCTAVSIDTRTALVRFWSHTHTRVGVPTRGLEYPRVFAKPVPAPIETRTPAYGYGFSGVRVRVALENPRVTRANP